MDSRTFAGSLRELWDFRVFLKYQCLGKLKLRTTGTYLGHLWWLLDPLLFLGIFYVVFKVILRRGGPDFVLFLFCALLPWRWFSTSISEACVSVRGQSGLLKQVYFPKIIAPLTSVFTNTVNFMFGLVILAVMMFIFKPKVGWNLVYFPAIVLVQLLFTTGFSLLLAHANVYFRDTADLLRYLIQMWFYLSPGVYPIAAIPQPYRSVVQLNPFAALFQSYRDVLMYDRFPHFIRLFVLAAGSLVLIWYSVRLIARNQGDYAKVL